MKKMRPYKGYTASVEFDPDEMLLYGRIDNLRDVITFHAESVGELQGAFQEAVDDYLNLCAERGDEAERPFSGRFVVRLDPDLHRQVASDAERRGVSINTWLVQSVRLALAEGSNDMSEPLSQRLALHARGTLRRSATYVLPETIRPAHGDDVDARTHVNRLAHQIWADRRTQLQPAQEALQ